MKQTVLVVGLRALCAEAGVLSAQEVEQELLKLLSAGLYAGFSPATFCYALLQRPWLEHTLAAGSPTFAGGGESWCQEWKRS